MAAELPDPIRVVNAWAKTRPSITNLVAKRISHELEGVYPAIRLTDLGPSDRSPDEWRFRVQVECWADDYDTARSAAAAVNREVEAGTLQGTWLGAFCAGGAVTLGPFASPDQKTGRHRHLLELGLWLYPGT